MTTPAPLLACVAAGLLSIAAAPAGAQDLTRYREFALGSSVDAVITATRTVAADVKVVHQRPRLIQELLWRPRYTPGRSLVPDAAREIRFAFLDDQLFKIEVFYDAHEIEGLTVQDLVGAISTVYGPPSDGGEAAVAQWRDGAFRVTLTEESYLSPYRLMLVSTTLEQSALTASVEAQRLDRIEAPKREAARLAEAAERRRVEGAATREKNKAGFQP